MKKNTLTVFLISFCSLISVCQTTENAVIYKGEFTLEGSSTLYYPVAFIDGARSSNKATMLELGRTDIHLNGSSHGSLIAVFRYHVTNWGHASHFIDADIKQYSQNLSAVPFIADYTDSSGTSSSSRIIIWLRGGSTYYYNSNCKQEPVFTNGEITVGGNAYGIKTKVEDHINSYGLNVTNNIWVKGTKSNYFAGNVGIGTLNPEYKLEVNGGLKTKSLVLETANRTEDWNSMHESGFYTGNTNTANSPESNAYFWGINLGNAAGVSTNRNGAQILIRHISGNPVMYFRNRTQDGDGKWAKVLHDQGSQSINGGLTVDGTIKAREVKVQTDVWSDFVFSPDYNLRPLNEVKSFIKDNRHLPGVPSEKEVIAEGIDLAAMNAVLLQKIEELTLYIIEQQKNILLYQKDISDQKKNMHLIQQRLKQLETK